MQPSRILPDLQASLICEEVRQERNGNLMLIGLIEVIQVPQVPVTAPQLCIYNRWTAGVGSFNQTIRMLAPDGTTVMRQNQVKFQLQDPRQSLTNVTVFGQIQFDVDGVYYIEVLVDDVMKLRYPLLFRIVTPPAAGQPGAAPTATPAA